MGLTEILFFAAAAYAFASALAVVVSANTVTAALYFVSHLLAVAVLYAFLNAPLIAVLQVMVYAGAVMILFIFAIMILDASVLEKMNPVREKAHWVAGIVMGAALAALLGGAANHFHPSAILAPPSGASLPGTEGNVRGVALLLFRENLFSFELVGVLLMVAVVGVIVLAKKRLEA